MDHITEDVTRDIICDPVDNRLTIARHFLGKITPSIPKENSFEHFLLEANIDAFLFFSSSIIDMIKIEINDRFDLFDKENVFYIHGIRKKLGNAGVQKQVKDTIAKYFSVPTHQRPSSETRPRHIKTDQGYFDATDSTLWELQILRNKVTHGKILNIADHKITLDFTIRDFKGLKTPPKYQVTVENPKEYFGQVFDNLTQFVRQIRLLNPQKTQSFHHTEQFDFKLE
ncbi:hypothetical protein [Candidatus Nitrosotenuis sp. DW1]|uniref:hypothetical protein n=1 Tax=Candidatus Nitrosotenuis sp. DW1 TaxID=2259672 RepID=UPI0015C76D11|nr:hypothetical protein [Candidatus Nitrosotenuis sp. DW1]QLH09149.1 hypothetical protein DSQ19_06425 [Candidatus Nitrosotenuis sp. DW1]